MKRRLVWKEAEAKKWAGGEANERDRDGLGKVVACSIGGIG